MLNLIQHLVVMYYTNSEIPYQVWNDDWGVRNDDLGRAFL